MSRLEPGAESTPATNALRTDYASDYEKASALRDDVTIIESLSEPRIRIDGVPLAPPLRKIAVIGSAPSSLPLAPFADTSWEIWGCSPGAGMHPACTRVTRWFEIHPLSQPDIVGDQAYLRWLADINVPVELIRPDPRIPKGVAYPYEAMLQEFGPYFFTSSVAWILARAIMERPHTIGLWGIDMNANEEYQLQRPACHFFIREALKLGIKVFVPSQSDLAHPPAPYGFIMQSDEYRKLVTRKAELETAAAAAAADYEHKRNIHHAHMGALDNLNYILRTFVNDPRR